MFEIRSGIPIPPRQSGYRKYPWRRMRLNDSFMVPCPEHERSTMMNSLTSCIRHASMKTGFKFTQRAINGGIRVWRIQ